MVTVQHVVAMQDERDVAVRAPQRRPARPAMDRRRDAAPVEQQDRLAALRCHAAERGEQALRAAAMQAGMRSMREDGARWIAAGITSPEEILRVTGDG